MDDKCIFCIEGLVYKDDRPNETIFNFCTDCGEEWYVKKEGK